MLCIEPGTDRPESPTDTAQSSTIILVAPNMQICRLLRESAELLEVEPKAKGRVYVELDVRSEIEDRYQLEKDVDWRIIK